MNRICIDELNGKKVFRSGYQHSRTSAYKRTQQVEICHIDMKELGLAGSSIIDIYIKSHTEVLDLFWP